MSQPPFTPRRRGARGPAPASPVNLRDVARAAGVSPATVSRVLSGGAAVSQQTRDKVNQAVDELGYVVNRLAQAMMGTGQRHLGFVASGFGDANDEIFAGAEQTAADHDRMFVTAATRGEQERERRLIEALCQQRVAGVVRVGPTVPGKAALARIADHATALAAVGARLVLADHPYLPSLPQVPTVGCDRMGGTRQGVRHLVEAGHTRIAFLGWANSTTANQHFLGYSVEMKQAKLDIESSWVVSCPDQTVDAQLATLLFMKASATPTAIVCVSDAVAIGVCRAARDLGIAIPGQLAVVGFGDSPYCADLSPPLTTVAAPFHEIGVRAGELALGLPTAHQVELPTQLVVRDSTGEPQF